MGQKIHPIGFRLPITKKWTSRWYAKGSNYPKTLVCDVKVRVFLKQRLRKAMISEILIERSAKNALITVSSGRPGVVIGKKGEDIEALKNELQLVMGVPVHVNIEEVRKPETDPNLIADVIAQQLEKRQNFRRVAKRAMNNAARLGVTGIKIQVSGRLNGAEIARCEAQREGRVPLQTLRADIGYGVAEAFTSYGIIGVKVWVNRGDFSAKRELHSEPERDPEVLQSPSEDRKRFSRKNASRGDSADSDATGSPDASRRPDAGSRQRSRRKNTSGSNQHKG